MALHPDHVFFGDLLQSHVAHVYGKGSVDFMGTPTENVDVEVLGRFSWYKKRRNHSAQGDDVAKTAEFTTFSDFGIHESDRITIEGLYEPDGLTLKSFEVVQVSPYHDEFGVYHHQTVSLR